jgi:hypothetical protein
MFRSAEFSRELFRDVAIEGVRLPFRADYVNGRLDPDVHKSPATLRVRDTRRPTERPWLITLGLDGEITARPDQPGAGLSQATGSTPDAGAKGGSPAGRSP